MIKNQQKRFDFSSYLAGLIEGDGIIIIPSQIRDSKNIHNVDYEQQVWGKWKSNWLFR